MPERRAAVTPVGVSWVCDCGTEVRNEKASAAVGPGGVVTYPVVCPACGKLWELPHRYPKIVFEPQ